MGGLGPGIGGLEYIVIGLVALLVLGPERLPVMMRKVGQWVGKARAMAAEFRSSFDEMARQSELDDLRKEVEALRTHQGIHRLGADADAAFREIRDDLNAAPTTPTPAPAVVAPAPAPALTSPDGWSEVDTLQAAPTPPSEIGAPAAKARPKAKRAAAKPAAASARSPAKARTKAASSTSASTAAKPKRKPAARKPKP